MIKVKVKNTVAGADEPAEEQQHETQLSDTLKLRISLNQFQGKWGLSIWRFWRRRGESDWHPADKGLRVGTFAELEFIYETLGNLLPEAAERLPVGEKEDL